MSGLLTHIPMQWVKAERVGFILFSAMIMVFFILPDPEVTQKPFRIGLALFFALTYLVLLINQQISIRSVIPVIIAIVLMLIMARRGTLQTSYINALLCFFGILIFKKLRFNLTPGRLFDLNLIHFLCMISIIIQFLVFSSSDGRPSMGYELNLSGAYLFLFFLLSDLLDRKDGKILVIALSFILLSRLLIFSLLLFFLIRYSKKYLPPIVKRTRFMVIAILSYILISLFSVWYVATIKSRVSYDTSLSRLTTLNDGSNQWRFLTNTLVMARIVKAPTDANTLMGFGPVENFIKSTKGSLVMPHNELYDALVQFGILTVIFFAFFTLPAYNSHAGFANLEYILPLLFYTMILWVRFILVPSFEMIFILFILHMVNQKNSTTETTIQPDAPLLSVA